MTERQFRDLETQIARRRFLEQEVTHPLAACLVHFMILEEADLGIVGPVRQPWGEARRSYVAPNKLTVSHTEAN